MIADKICVSVLTEEDYRHCHEWWGNFASHVEKIYGETDDYDDPMTLYSAIRDAELKKFNAIFVGSNVYFDSDQDKTFFMLKWS